MTPTPTRDTVAAEAARKLTNAVLNALLRSSSTAHALSSSHSEGIDTP
jgi:hypothetical protein